MAAAVERFLDASLPAPNGSAERRQSEERLQQIEAEQTRLLYAQAPIAFVVSVFNATLLAFFLRRDVHAPTLMAWWVLLISALPRSARVSVAIPSSDLTGNIDTAVAYLVSHWCGKRWMRGVRQEFSFFLRSRCLINYCSLLSSAGWLLGRSPHWRWCELPISALSFP